MTGAPRRGSALATEVSDLELRSELDDPLGRDPEIGGRRQATGGEEREHARLDRPHRRARRRYQRLATDEIRGPGRVGPQLARSAELQRPGHVGLVPEAVAHDDPEE